MARHRKHRRKHGHIKGHYRRSWSSRLFDDDDDPVPVVAEPDPKPRAPRKKKEPPLSIAEAAAKPVRKFRIVRDE